MRKDAKWYLEKTKDLLQMSPLENQFQNLLIYPFLEEMFSEESDIK